MNLSQETSDTPSIPSNFPDKKMAQKLARQAINLSNLSTPPIIIDIIVKSLQNIGGKLIKKGELLSEGFSGQIVQMSGITGIMYNVNQNIHRKRFTVAHELGHFMMNHAMGVTYKEIYNLRGKNKIEKEANIFAAELLIPKDILIKTLKTRKYSVVELSQLFNVSEEAMWYKIDSDNLVKFL